jgi:hypothetical protein
LHATIAARLTAQNSTTNMGILWKPRCFSCSRAMPPREESLVVGPPNRRLVPAHVVDILAHALLAEIARKIPQIGHRRALGRRLDGGSGCTTFVGNHLLGLRPAADAYDLHMK